MQFREEQIRVKLHEDTQLPGLDETPGYAVRVPHKTFTLLKRNSLLSPNKLFTCTHLLHPYIL